MVFVLFNCLTALLISFFCFLVYLVLVFVTRCLRVVEVLETCLVINVTSLGLEGQEQEHFSFFFVPLTRKTPATIRKINKANFMLEIGYFYALIWLDGWLFTVNFSQKRGIFYHFKQGQVNLFQATFGSIWIFKIAWFLSKI